MRLRPFTLADADVCADICYRAFRSIGQKHNFPGGFHSVEAARATIVSMTGPGRYGVVAEVDGRIAGSNFVDERAVISGIGPITVDPAVQGAQVGRRLMRYVMERAEARGVVGMRLVQAAYNTTSISLYTKLGFVVREPLASFQGSDLGVQVPGCTVRQARSDDLAACNRLCFRAHGFDRSDEVQEAIDLGWARVVERGGRLTGYCTALSYAGHAVGETNDDLKALIGSGHIALHAKVLVPTRNTELFRWCIEQGLRVTEPMTLMSIGLYSEPARPFLPSVLF